MGRYSYDDMPPEGYRERRESGRKGTFVIAFTGILVTLIAIILYLLYTPREAVPEVKEQEEAMVSDTAIPAQPEEVEAVEIQETVAEEPQHTESEVPLSLVRPLDSEKYIVKEGDTLLSIADKAGVTAETIKDYNSISDTKLVPGTVISIPEYSGMMYTVQDGDSLDAIAESYNPELSSDDLAALNDLGSKEIEAGTEIFIPSVGTELKENEALSSPLPGGRIIKRYAEFYADRRESVDGVVIAAAPGTPVLSASDGIVTGVGMSGGRRYVEITSPEGLILRYSDIESPLVRKGAETGKGSIIGMVGSSSIYYGEPALLFSVSQDGISIDPEDAVRF